MNRCQCHNLYKQRCPSDGSRLAKHVDPPTPDSWLPAGDVAAIGCCQAPACDWVTSATFSVLPLVFILLAGARHEGHLGANDAVAAAVMWLPMFVWTVVLLPTMLVLLFTRGWLSGGWLHGWRDFKARRDWNRNYMCKKLWCGELSNLVYATLLVTVQLLLVCLRAEGVIGADWKAVLAPSLLCMGLLAFVWVLALLFIAWTVLCHPCRGGANTGEEIKQLCAWFAILVCMAAPPIAAGGLGLWGLAEKLEGGWGLHWLVLLGLAWGCFCGAPLCGASGAFTAGECGLLGCCDDD